jgi:hypothetical protein
VLLISIIVLVVLLVASGSAAFALLRHSPAPTPTPVVQNTATSGVASPTSSQATTTPDLTQTAQAGVQASATARAQATASAVANATGTASAQASATAGPLQTATSGTPDYQSSLKNGNDSTANWDENSQCVFAADGYHVLQPASGSYFKGCREQGKTYGDLELSVDVNILSGHSGGVFFRLGTNLIGNYDGYLYEIDDQGDYKISYEQGSGINVLKDWSATPLLKSGDHQTNLLQLIARGSTLTFYANGKYLTQIQDSYDTTANTIGFLATASQGGSDAEVVYSNLKVYAL